MSETAESKHYESDPEIVEQFMEIFNSKSFPTNVKFQFIGSTKQKVLIKIKKIADDYAFLLNEKELLVLQSYLKQLLNLLVLKSTLVRLL
jgi:hypothetical protein